MKRFKYKMLYVTGLDNEQTGTLVCQADNNSEALKLLKEHDESAQVVDCERTELH